MALSLSCDAKDCPRRGVIHHPFERETSAAAVQILSEREAAINDTEMSVSRSFLSFGRQRRMDALPDIASQTNARSGPCAMQSFADLFRGDHRHGFRG
jgi:hypothetical protein